MPDGAGSGGSGKLGREGGAVGLVPVPIARSDMTIDEVFQRFLAEQRERLAERTYRRYEEVIELLGDCLNNYAYQSLDELERRRWQKEFDSNEDGAFCRLFGPDKIAENLGEFLDYFMVRKVIARPGITQSVRHGHSQVDDLARAARLHR